MVQPTSILMDYLKDYQAGNQEAGYEIIRSSQIQNIIGRTCSKWIPEYEPEELQHLCHLAILDILRKFKIPVDSDDTQLLKYLNKALPFRLINALKKLRKRDTEVSLEAEVHTSSDGDSVTLKDTLKSQDKGPEEQFLIKEKQETVRAAIRKLTPNQQQIVYMYYYEEMTQNQIANELGISQVAVVKTLQRAQETLRLLLQGVE